MMDKSEKKYFRILMSIIAVIAIIVLFNLSTKEYSIFNYEPALESAIERGFYGKESQTVEILKELDHEKNKIIFHKIIDVAADVDDCEYGVAELERGWNFLYRMLGRHRLGDGNLFVGLVDTEEVRKLLIAGRNEEAVSVRLMYADVAFGADMKELIVNGLEIEKFDLTNDECFILVGEVSKAKTSMRHSERGMPSGIQLLDKDNVVIYERLYEDKWEQIMRSGKGEELIEAYLERNN